MGMSQDMSKEDVLRWWRVRCEEFVLDMDSLDEQIRQLLVQAMAVKSIFTQIQTKGATLTSCAPAVAVEHIGAVTCVACTQRNGSQSSSGPPQVSAPTVSTDELALRQAPPKTWQYIGGKQGQGGWKWIDENIARVLETAWRVGQETVLVRTEDGWQCEYNLIRMEQTNIPTGNDRKVTRAVRQVTGDDNMQ
jgi:hypothetical protein